MLKKLGILLAALSILLLVGCNMTQAPKDAKSAVAEKQEKGLTIKNRDFAGTHDGAGTKEDPTYQYSMHFGQDGQFVQDIIASKGYSGRFTEKGTYRIDKTNKKIVMTIKAVTEERFASDNALTNGEAPTAFYERSNGDVKSPLNKAEDHPIDIKIADKYLLGSVNGVKLYPTKKATVNYAQHYASEKSKYINADNWFSGKSFVGGIGIISFKSGKFIWQYASLGDAIHSVAIAQGNYTVSSNDNEITLKVLEKTPLYKGPNAENFQYTTIGVSPFESVQTVTLKKISESRVQSDNISSFGTQTLELGDGGDRYSSFVDQWAVATTKVRMRKMKNLTVTDLFPTVNDFSNWVVPIFEKKHQQNFYVVARQTDIVEGETGRPYKYRVVMSTKDPNDDSDTPGSGASVFVSSEGEMVEDTAADQENGIIIHPSSYLQEKYDDYKRQH